MPFQVTLPFYEFQEYFCGDMTVKKFYDTYEQFADSMDDKRVIEIEYSYGEYKVSNKTLILYRPVESDEWSQMTYNGSSHFAMWWCEQTNYCEDEACDDCGNPKGECDCGCTTLHKIVISPNAESKPLDATDYEVLSN